MLKNAEILQLRISYIEIGKLVQKYGDGQYNGMLNILMGQVNCINSDDSDDEKLQYLIDSYNRLFISRGGLSDFVIYDENYEIRKQLNERFSEEIKKNLEDFERVYLILFPHNNTATIKRFITYLFSFLFGNHHKTGFNFRHEDSANQKANSRKIFAVLRA